MNGMHSEHTFCDTAVGTKNGTQQFAVFLHMAMLAPRPNTALVRDNVTGRKHWLTALDDTG